jgi:hypothetical protein
VDIITYLCQKWKPRNGEKMAVMINYRLAYQSLLLEEKVPPEGADVV